MTTSQTQMIADLAQPEIRSYWIGYFREGFRASLQRELLEAFDVAKAKRGLTRADLARKIGRRPEQVSRWLSSAANLEAETISDMALGVGCIPHITFEEVETYVARVSQTNIPPHPVAAMMDEIRNLTALRLDVHDGNESVGYKTNGGVDYQDSQVKRISVDEAA